VLNSAIVGATGYTGVELIKILARHSQVRMTCLTTRQKQTISVKTLVPSLPKDFELEIRPYGFREITRAAELIFLCLPHTEAMSAAKKFLDAGKVVIDLSADFRLHRGKDYERWYGVRHRHPGLLKKAVYGLPEIYRSEIRKADLIANPGCYPTGAILGLWPLLKNKLVDRGSIVIDAKSGVSGAGKKLNPATQFCEVGENFYAYKVNRHQHTPEIVQTLSEASKGSVSITFVPHLLPIQRGILTTMYLRKRKGVKDQAIAKALIQTYQKEPFVRVKAEGLFPMLKDVQHTNFCDIGFSVDSKTSRVIVITAIDNLLKGASGQAVQNMNVRFGFPEVEGLRA
jgi:N-acetyl-gamma-glutamyl-phosphate reductase